MQNTTRLLAREDASELSALLTANRDFLAPWEPTRDASFFTEESQLAIALRALDAYAHGTMIPLVIQNDGGAIAGRINLNGITQGAFQSASLAYWVSESLNGRGLATTAVAESVVLAFDELGLHRLQAETLVHNVASQRVLVKNGFRPYGLAEKYLKISGSWQDHIVYQRIAHNDSDFHS